MERVFQKFSEFPELCIREIYADTDLWPTPQQVKTDSAISTFKIETTSSRTTVFHGYGSAKASIMLT